MLYKREANGLIQCFACAHRCLIPQNRSGICGVRENDGEKLNVLVYGRPSAVNADPIEKKPLFHFFPGSSALSIGTFGCNYNCGFCQNWEISQMKTQINPSDNERRSQIFSDVIKKGSRTMFEQIEYLSPGRAVLMAKERKTPSIAYTYNEPAIWAEYAVDIAQIAQGEGIKNVFVSNGYLSPECAEYVAPYIDAFNIDLKSYNDEFYRQTCGARLTPVLDTIKYLHSRGMWVEITTLVIPQMNDSEKELRQIAEFICGVDANIPWHLSAFHGEYKMREHPPTEEKSLRRAYEIGKKAGLKYVYIGNVDANEYGHTFCPSCNNLLIEREFFEAKIKGMDGNKCKKCGEEIAGRF